MTQRHHAAADLGTSGSQPCHGRALGQEVRYNGVAPEVNRRFGFRGAQDLGNMFQFKRDFNDYFRRVRDVNFARTLNRELQTFEDWLARHKGQIPLE